MLSARYFTCLSLQNRGNAAPDTTCVLCAAAGSFDKFLNIQITLIILLQLAMCALHGSLGLWWRNQHANNRYYLATTVQGQARLPTHHVSAELLLSVQLRCKPCSGFCCCLARAHTGEHILPNSTPEFV